MKIEKNKFKRSSFAAEPLKYSLLCNLGEAHLNIKKVYINHKKGYTLCIIAKIAKIN